MNQINLDSKISRSETLLSNNLGEDVVMMDIEQGAYYGLESVAAQIWKLTEQPISVGSLCDQLQSEYDISSEQCQQDVTQFLGELLDRKIIYVVN